MWASGLQWLGALYVYLLVVCNPEVGSIGFILGSTTCKWQKKITSHFHPWEDGKRTVRMTQLTNKTDTNYPRELQPTRCFRPVRHHHLHGPLTRYVKLRVVHVRGMLGTFSPPPRVIDPDMHHVRDAHAVMHARISNQRFPLKSAAWKTFPAFPAHAQPAT